MKIILMKYNKRDSIIRIFVFYDLRFLLFCCRWIEGLFGFGLLF